jgi:hypothetical protein
MEERLPAENFPGEWNKAVECPWDRAQYRDDFSPRYRREYYSDSASARDKVSAVAVDTPAALNMWLFGVTLGGATAMSCSRWSEPKSETAKKPSNSCWRFNRGPHHSATRQGERSAHVLSAVVDQAVDLSAWQTLQAFGIFKASLIAGVTNRNVWLRTFTSAMVCWIFGMWQEMHSLPSLPAL